MKLFSGTFAFGSVTSCVIMLSLITSRKSLISVLIDKLSYRVLSTSPKKPRTIGGETSSILSCKKFVIMTRSISKSSISLNFLTFNEI